MCGVGLGLLYTYHYGDGDTIQYHIASTQLTAIGQQNHSLYTQLLQADRAELEQLVPDLYYINQPRAFFVVKLLSLLNFLTGGYYWINSLYFSFFSFWGGWRLVVVLARAYPSLKAAAAVAFLFYPSVIFWSSGLLKESLAFGCISFLCAIALQIFVFSKITLFEILGFIIAAWLLWVIKFYYAAALLPLLVSAGFMYWLLARYTHKPQLVAMCGIAFFSIAGLGLYIATNFHYALNLDVLPLYVLELYTETQAISAEGASAQFNLEPTYASLLFHLPKAVLTGLFRPLPWEAHTFIALVASFENLLLITSVLLLACSWIYIKIKNPAVLHLDNQTGHLLWQWAFAGSILIYVILLAWLIALTSPNFGTLLRYRIGYLPFFIFLITAGLIKIKSIYARRLTT